LSARGKRGLASKSLGGGGKCSETLFGRLEKEKVIKENDASLQGEGEKRKA